MSRKYVITATCFDAKGRMISVANNNYSKSHPIQAHFARLAGEPYKINLHAEIAAILKCKDKNIHSILVQRFDSNGNPRLAKPCKVCETAIMAYGIKRIIYTTNQGKEEVIVQ